MIRGGKTMSYSINLLGDLTGEVLNELSNLLNSLPQDAREVILNISSGGGPVTIGVTMYNLLRKCRVPVHTHNMGEVSSAAILPYLAGTIRTAEPISKFMFHPFAIMGEGNMPYAAVNEKLNILESDLKNYAAIIKKEAPAFCEKYNIMDVLKYQTVIISEQRECAELGILKK